MNIFQTLFLTINNFFSNLDIFSNIKSYSGDYKNALYHGKGRLEFKDGSVYEGQFENNKMHGYGKIFFKDGSIYQGNFKNNLRDGTGISKNKEGIQERVIFKNGKFKGNFKETFTIHWQDNVSGTVEITAKDSGEAIKIFENFSKDDLYRKSQWVPDQKTKVTDISILSSDEDM